MTVRKYEVVAIHADRTEIVMPEVYGENMVHVRDHVAHHLAMTDGVLRHVEYIGGTDGRNAVFIDGVLHVVRRHGETGAA